MFIKSTTEKDMLKNTIVIEPIVSIIIPFFNAYDLFVPMYRSIVNQSYQKWELLLVDDGSFEDALDSLNELVSSDNRVRIIKRNRLPKGAPTCRNIGIDYSNGKYIVFFDSDDLLSNKCLENRVSFMEEDPDVECGIFPAIAFNEKVYDLKKPRFGINLYRDILGSFIIRELPYTVWTNIYRKEAIINHSLYWDEHLLSWQDSDYNLSSIFCGLNIRYAFDKMSNDLEYDYFWRIFGGQITKRIYSEQHLSSCIYYINKNINKIINTRNSNLYKNYIRYFLIKFAINEFYYKRGFNLNQINIPISCYDLYKLNLLNRLSSYIPFSINKVFVFFLFPILIIDIRLLHHCCFKNPK